MRSVASILFAVLGLTFGSPAVAQTPEDMQRCRAISDDTRRLACYDAIDLLPGPRSKYALLDLSELKNYALSYRGQLVEVSGWIKPGSEVFFLGLDESDERPIPIDFDSLARRDRQSFLDACGAGCEATVQGRVKPVNFTTGIVADSIIAH